MTELQQPQVDGGALLNGISAVVRQRLQRDPSPPSALRRHDKISVSLKRALNQACQHPGLGLQPLKP